MKTLFEAILIIFFAGIAPIQIARADGTGVQMTVYKSPTCGCCQKWVEYMKERGYAIQTHNVQAMNEVKAALGLTDPQLHSCHTAVVGDYVIEGHVPEADIARLLRERPNIHGLTAPGMPMLSPGMNSIEPKDYDVLQIDKAGNTSVYRRY